MIFPILHYIVIMYVCVDTIQWTHSALTNCTCTGNLGITWINRTLLSLTGECSVCARRRAVHGGRVRELVSLGQITVVRGFAEGPLTDSTSSPSSSRQRHYRRRGTQDTIRDWRHPTISDYSSFSTHPSIVILLMSNYLCEHTQIP